MFQVLIADDEPSVVHSLMESVSWEELDFEVAATAASGDEALQKIRENPIDVAILDIRMPGLNGLELCERLKEENSRIQIIIISGYAEFAYAQKAIQYGVLGYCLKPLEYGQVTQYLRKAAQNILEMDHVAVRTDILEILSGDNTEEITEEMQRLGFPGGSCHVAVSVGEKRLEMLEQNGISIRMGKGQWGYLMRMQNVESSREALEETEGWRGIGYLKTRTKAGDIYEALEECRVRAYQFFVDDTWKICADFEEGKAGSWIEAVRKKINDGRWDLLPELLRTIDQEGQKDFTVRSALRLCNLIYSVPLFQNEENDNYIYSVEQLADEYGTFREMLQKLTEMLQTAMQEETQALPFTNTAFLKLLRYVNENYRGNISLTSAAAALYMKPNYVSQMFKKEAGVTFVHYVTQKRLEDAKKLLVTTKKPLSDIAIEVGFNDSFYFIKTFKKFVGVTPGQYRMEN